MGKILGSAMGIMAGISGIANVASTQIASSVKSNILEKNADALKAKAWSKDMQAAKVEKNIKTIKEDQKYNTNDPEEFKNEMEKVKNLRISSGNLRESSSKLSEESNKLKEKAAKYRGYDMDMFMMANLMAQEQQESKSYQRRIYTKGGKR